MKKVTQAQKEMIVDWALNSAVALIQEKLEIDNGDYAGLFFDGSEKGEKIEKMFLDYIEFEEENRMTDIYYNELRKVYAFANLNEVTFNMIYNRAANLISQNGYEYERSIHSEFEREYESYMYYKNVK